MKRSILFLFLFFIIHHLFAQDTLWVKQEKQLKYIQYTVEENEDLFSISKKFKIPPARLADDNNTDFRVGVKPGSLIKIAIENFNYHRINSVVASRPIYLRTTPNDDLRSISHLFYIPQSVLQEWNELKNPHISTGQVLKVGWISFENSKLKNLSAKESPKNIKAQKKLDSLIQIPNNKNGILKNKDTLYFPVDSIFIQDSLNQEENFGFKDEFNDQTNGFSLSSEAGAGVFYSLKMTMKKGQYYAMHAYLPRGTIIQVESPANNMVVYAKVIGPLPKINKYHNSIIALSSNAKGALGLRESRFFCKIKYR